MFNRASTAIVLAEDGRQQQVVLRYLERIGFKGAVRRVDLPNGRGCGEQWVREHYPKEVRACRKRHAKTWLIVTIDADVLEVSRRAAQLSSALREEKIPQREEGEPIVHLISKRAIETWILCLGGEQVDEGTDYRYDARVDRFKSGQSAAKLFEMSRPNAPVPADCVPSLLAAIPELRRLDQ